MHFPNAALVATLFVTAGAAGAADAPVIGLFTKTETNPFFVAMKDGASAEARAKDAKLLTAAGKSVTDHAGQVTALENMIAAGAKTILITVSDTKAIVPVLRKARDKGVLVIALDTATDPTDAADALLATDNYLAGVLIGQYAKAAIGTNPVVVCTVDSFGDQAKGQTAMETCLQKNPDVNLVYTVNEPAAAGAFNALKKAGKEKGVTIVSIDGGCEGVRNVATGMIAATSQQYPLKMGAMGVAAGVEFAKTGKKPSGYTDTGVTLIADKAVTGVDSKDVKTGTDLCWGKK